MPETSVDTEAMMKAAPAILDLVGRVQNIYSTLSGRLDDAGSAWGADDTGDAFAANYNQPKTSLLGSLTGSAQALSQTHDGVVTMAKGFAGTEAENRASIHVPSDNASTGAPHGSLG